MKKDSKCYVELPPEFSGQESVEFFPLKDGYYLLTIPLENAGRKPSSPAHPVPVPLLSGEEKSLLSKLFSIRFDQRIPSRVEKMLNEKEKQLLKTLLEKGYVNTFQSKKYPQGVYNIRDSVYPLLTGHESWVMSRGERSNEPGAYESKPKTSPSNQLPKTQAAKAATSLPISQTTDILSDGYAVIDDARLAAQFSEQLRRQGKSNIVRGIKGFDGKFYAVTKSYFSKTAPLVLKALDEPQNAESLAKACKLPLPACLAILHLLGEEGDVVEKRKGIFVRA